MDPDELEEAFKQAYPNLADELTEGDGFEVDGVRSSSDEGEKAASMPTVTDHLRRCDTREEAIEIIDYFVDRQDIPAEHGSHLKRQLVSKGLRSFGPKREAGDIEKDGL